MNAQFCSNHYFAGKYSYTRQQDAVLTAVKAWPVDSGACGEVCATASLDGVCARRRAGAAGRDEETAAGRTKKLIRGAAEEYA